MEAGPRGPRRSRSPTRTEPAAGRARSSCLEEKVRAERGPHVFQVDFAGSVPFAGWNQRFS